MISDVKYKCTGCGACVAVCPIKAIKFEISNEGFWYPVISNKCISCGCCDRICPIKSKCKNNTIQYVYAARSKKTDMLLRSSSGAVFYELSMEIIKNGGVVVGAAYNYADNLIYHKVAVNEQELSELMKSKYVQSYISENIYDEIRVFLSKGITVLFSGTPCQVAAVKNLFENTNNFELLRTVDVVCHGVPSPLAWKSYVNYISMDQQGKLNDVSFRSKSNGWTNFNIELKFNDSKYTKWFNEDLWGMTFIENVFLRKCCYNCKFKNFEREADISLGDFWGIDKEYNLDDLGCSLVIVNSENGRRLFDSIKNKIEFKDTTYEKALSHNQALLNSAHLYSRRELAFAYLRKEMKFNEIVDKIFHPSFMVKVICKVRECIKTQIGCWHKNNEFE